MTRPQIALVAHAALLIGALFFLVPTLTAWDLRAGFLFSLTAYWLFFCLPVIGWHALRHNDGRLLSERLAWRNWFVPLLLFAQVFLVSLATFVPNTAMLTSGGMWLAILIALINGPLEELAWRGGFMSAFRDRPILGFWLGWLLFCAWHLPLGLSHGMIFEGGTLVLVGGAAIMGLFWSWIAWRTGSVFYVALAHMLTNVFAFWVLFDRNGFAS